MAKKKSRQRTVISQYDFDYIHLDITQLSGREIIMIVDKKPYFVSTCARIGCDRRYAYSGKNPQYCPKCLKFVFDRLRKAKNGS
jgi:hypothetical protein